MGLVAVMWLSSLLAAQQSADASILGIIDTSNMTRNVNTREPTAWRPSESQQSEPLQLFAAYRDHLIARSSDDAYAMLSPELQAMVTRPEWTALAAGRKWPASRIVLTRMTWYPDADAMTGGLKIAFDFRALHPSGDFACGYVLFDAPVAPGTPYRIAREEAAQVPASMLSNGLPPTDILAQLPCWLGSEVRTELNR